MGKTVWESVCVFPSACVCAFMGPLCVRTSAYVCFHLRVCICVVLSVRVWFCVYLRGFLTVCVCVFLAWIHVCVCVCACAALRPTGLVGGDVDGDVLGGIRALVAHAVHRLDVEGVRRVRPQVTDDHTRLRQAQPPRHKVHVVVARRARPQPVAAALPAQDVVGEVAAGAGLTGRVPLQDDGRLVDQ